MKKTTIYILIGTVVLAGGLFYFYSGGSNEFEISPTVSNENSSPSARLQVTEEGRYADDYFSHLAVVHEKLSNFGELEIKNEDETMEAFSTLLYDLGEIISAVDNAAIELGGYRDSTSENVALHSDAVVVGYKSLGLLYEEYRVAHEELLRSTTEQGVATYTISTSRILSGINNTLKTFPQLSMFLVPALLKEENGEELNAQLSNALVQRLEALFGDEIIEGMAAGQHAFVASGAIVRQLLLGEEI
ncbi:hypothetical protein JXR01_03605 [Candidatus Kaiserbacteria bacterium]|nr:MAG: hypothetical protein JXR01_03605 [Candidatus Kaiserbacteria bacterium]